YCHPLTRLSTLYSHTTLPSCNAPATTDIYTLSLHDALPISDGERNALREHDGVPDKRAAAYGRHRKDRKRLDDDTAADRDHVGRSEEHTSELQSRFDLVCRLLLEKKKIDKDRPHSR